MPWCPGTQRAKVGIFHSVLISILERKAREPGKPGIYTPYCTWDSFTEFSYRIVVTTICALTWLVLAWGVRTVIHCPGIFHHAFHLSGGYAGTGTAIYGETTPGTKIIYFGPTYKMNELSGVDTVCTVQTTADPNVPLLLIMSGDVEVNPGPSTEELINSLAERFEKRMDRFSEEFLTTSKTMNNMEKTLNSITKQLQERERDLQQVKRKVDSLEDTVKNLQDELERQQVFSRRDNLIFHGIPEGPERETHDDCANIVLDLMNEATPSQDRDRVWGLDDIARAHRLGKTKSGQRPIIVKLQRSRDKRTLITDKQLKEDLKKKKISMSDDLTRRQRQTLREERERGAIAYYRGGRLFTRPATQRGRSTTETTAYDSDDSRHEDPLQDQDHQRTPVPSPRPPSTGNAAPSPQSPPARSPDAASSPRPATDSRQSAVAAWRQFRQLSRDRGSGPEETSSSARPGRSVGGGRSQDTPAAGKVQTRSRKGTTDNSQRRVDQLMGQGQGRGGNSK